MTAVQAHHVARMERLDARHPGRFCWAELAILAVYGPRDQGPKALHRAQASVAECRLDSLDDDWGYCYCGAWHRGRYVGAGETDDGSPA
jgi:hypothetical protein